MSQPHIPVFVKAILEYFDVQGGEYLDCTFGAGGYTKALLEHPDAKVCAVDRDCEVSKYAEDISKKFGKRFNIQFGDFSNLENIVAQFPYQLFDGITFDVGVSSMQIDEAMRGFSFSKDGPLDMRMDRSQDIDAAFIVNSASEERLLHIIKNYGGEKKARAITKAIIVKREEEPIVSTMQLVALIRKAVGYYNDTIHPATRVFQALRIAVNDELSQLSDGLRTAVNLLKIGGKLAVVTFHSGEAEIVKQIFNSITSRKIKQNKYAEFSSVFSENQDSNFNSLTKKAILPSQSEIDHNPRARSAQLRIIQRQK